MSALTAKTVTQASLPIIDVSGLRSSDPEVRAQIGRRLRDACTDKGFFYIVGHGVTPELLAATFAHSERFFDLPEETKRRIDKTLSPCNRGYEPLRAQILEADAPPDLKEGFYIGVDLPESDPRVLAGKFNHGANQWPDALPDFRPTMQAYFDDMTALARRLMRGLALSLALPEAHFDDFCTDPIATLRLLHYPPQPAQPLPGEKGCGAHTDFGSLTILAQDDAGGLQVWDESQGWIHAPPVPGAFVVNLGDLIARWTNDRYRSTLHRVINTSGRERYSIPFFFTGFPDYIVSCLPTCAVDGEPARYAPVTTEQHLLECYRRTYA
jgi:isopenicillin N synthase-like dioxygenase